MNRRQAITLAVLALVLAAGVTVASWAFVTDNDHFVPGIAWMTGAWIYAVSSAEKFLRGGE